MPPRLPPAIASVGEVLHVDDAAYEHFLAENMGTLAAKLAKDFSHVLAPATTIGKNFMPRAAALLDVSQISDAIGIESPDTFTRPIYAGNAIATVQSSDKIKLITVRGTAFDAAKATGGDAPIKKIDGAGDSGASRNSSARNFRNRPGRNLPPRASSFLVVARLAPAKSSKNYWNPWPTSLTQPSARRGPRSMPVTFPTITRWAKPAKW